jgi:hypothetical protein
MAAVGYRFRAELRDRWRSWLVLAALAGLAGGVVLAALAGARRTDSAYPRFLESQRAYDVIVVSGRGDFFPFAEFDLAELANLPAVTDASRMGVPVWSAELPNGELLDEDSHTSLVPLDGRFGEAFNRLHFVRGHAPRRADEIAPSLVAAEEFELEVGDVLEARFLPGEIIKRYLAGEESVASFDFDDVPTTPLRVSGIAAAPGEFPPIEATAGNDPFIHFAPSFGDSPSFYPPVEALAVRLRGGADGVRAFVAELEDRAGDRPLFTIEQVASSAATQRSIGVQADALRVLAVVTAIAGFLVIGQLLVRQASLDGGDDPVLRAVGMSPGELVAVAALRAVAIATAGMVVAVGFAIALSPFMPIGLARNAETRMGVDLDPLVLGAGAAGVLAAVTSVFVLAAWLTVRAGSRSSAESSRRPHRALADRMARAGLSPTAVHGVRLALEPGRGSAAAPTRSTLVVVSLAVAAVVAVASFATSLDHLLDSPRLYGWNWDAIMGDQFTPDLGRATADELAADDRIDGVAVGAVLGVRVGDEQVDVLAMDSVKGGLGPVISDGRAPQSDEEIALGRSTLGNLDAAIGDRVAVRFAGQRMRMRVVGQAVLPGLGAAGGLGDGAVMTFGGARRLAPRAAANVVLVDIAPSADRPAVLRQLEEFPEYDGAVAVASRPKDLADLARIGSIPFVIGGVMVVVALATIMYGLVTSVRRRRRDLAVLKTLGLRSGQVTQVVLWQATTIALVALAVGIPVGLVAGNLVWRAFANQLGAVPETIVSVALVGALVPIVLIAANLAAAMPGRLAARTRPAIVLRSE